MRTVGLLIVFLFCGVSQYLGAQNKFPLLDYSSYQNKRFLEAVYKCQNDTLGFRKLNSKTSLNEYKMMENKDVYRTMKRIKRSVERYVIKDKVAGKRMVSLPGYGLTGRGRLDVSYILSSPAYLVTDKGIILVGQKQVLSPAYDIFTDWITLQCYWVGFDKQVEIIQTFRVHRREPLPSGSWEVLPEITYAYSGIEPGDTVTPRCPPRFMGEANLEDFLEARIYYDEKWLEEEIQGREGVVFTVQPDGCLTDVEIVRSVGLGDPVKAAIKETSGMWKPGLVDGEEVAVEVLVVVRFWLESERYR